MPILRSVAKSLIRRLWNSGGFEAPSRRRAHSREEHSYVFSTPKRFHLKKTHSFRIKDHGGHVMFRVTEKNLSLHEGKTLRDSRGHPLYKIKQKVKSTRGKRSVLLAASGQTVLTLKRKSARPGRGRSVVLVYEGSASEAQEPWLVCKGNHRRTKFYVEERSGGRRLASIKWNVISPRTALGRTETYSVKVDPGVNAALMIVIALAIDSIYTVPVVDKFMKEMSSMVM